MLVANNWLEYCEILRLVANLKHHRLIAYITTKDDAELKVLARGGKEVRRRASNLNAVPSEAGQELGQRRYPLIPLP